MTWHKAYLTIKSPRSRGASKSLAALLTWSAAAGTIAAATATPVHAQVSDASLRGKVTAEGEAAATQVTAIEVDTGLKRSVPVRKDGSYVFASLRPGTYLLELTTEDGIRRTDEFTLLVGQNAELDFDFSETDIASGTGDDIIVTANRIKTMEGGEVGVNITERLVEQLPQNNRNFLAFADLAPGVQFVTGGNGNSRIQGGAQPSSSINVFIDGVSQKDFVLKNGITGQDSTQGNPFPQLAIGEYRVISSNYKAEFDQVSSAAITAITKSGTNEFHGDAFIDFTNQDLRDATPNELADGEGKVETQDIQYGVALGGPIIRDVLHFFVTYEGKRQEVPVDITPGGGLSVDAFPAEYQGDFGTLNRTFDEDLYFGKLNFSPSDADLFELSVKYRNETGVNLNSGQLAESTATNINTEELRGLFRYERSEDTWINDFKISYEDASWAPTPRVFANSFRFENDNNDLLLETGAGGGFQDKGQEGWTIQNDFTYIGLDRHTIKMGIKAKWVTLDSLQLNRTNPLYSYNTDFNPNGGTFNDEIPFRLQFGAATGVGDPIVESDNFQFGIYIQDDWDITDRLTLNLGIRWDYEETPSYLDFVHPDDAVAAVSPENYPNLINANYDINDFISTGSERKAFTGAFQPRIGFNYRIDDAARFNLFGGYGRSYDRNQFDFLQQELSVGSFAIRTFNFITGDPNRTCTPSPTCIAFDPVYLTPEGRQQLVDSAPGGGRELRFFDNDLKTPYSDQFSLGLRGQFNNLQVEVGYSHIESRDGFALLLGNRRLDGSFFEEGATPQSPFGFSPDGFGSVIIGTNGLETSADSAYLKLTKPYSQTSPWSLDATYTYTEAEENRAFGQNFSLDYPSLDDYPVLRSSGVPRHRFVAAASVDLPWNFALSGKFTYQSPVYLKGFVNQDVAPFERLIVGTEAESNGDRWGLRQMDLAITKYVPLKFVSPEARMRFRVDIINLFNDRNYTQFNGNPNDDERTESSPSIFGERSSLALGGNPPRTIKFSAGFSF